VKKTIVVLLAVLAFLAMPVYSHAAPLGLTLGVEAEATDLTNTAEDDELNMTLKPFIDYALGDTGFLFELNYKVPVLPDVDDGWAEAWEEYDFSAAGLDFAIGNDNIWYAALDDDAIEGSIYASATYGLAMVEGLSVAAELDGYYAAAGSDNDVIFDAIVTPTYSADLGPGKLALKLRNYIHLYEKDTDANFSYVELRASYALPVGPVTVKLDLRPRLAGKAMTDDTIPLPNYGSYSGGPALSEESAEFTMKVLLTVSCDL
jgi:hypothetical protein